MSIKVMRLALAALEWHTRGATYIPLKSQSAIAALRQAIEQAEQAQPVVTRFPMKLTCTKCGTIEEGFLNIESDAPPPHQPLRDEEIKAVIATIDPDEQYMPNALKQFARAIEAKLKEKNT